MPKAPCWNQLLTLFSADIAQMSLTIQNAGQNAGNMAPRMVAVRGYGDNSVTPFTSSVTMSGDSTPMPSMVPTGNATSMSGMSVPTT